MKTQTVAGWEVPTQAVKILSLYVVEEIVDKLVRTATAFSTLEAVQKILLDADGFWEPYFKKFQFLNHGGRQYL